MRALAACVRTPLTHEREKREASNEREPKERIRRRYFSRKDTCAAKVAHHVSETTEEKVRTRKVAVDGKIE